MKTIEFYAFDPKCQRKQTGAAFIGENEKHLSDTGKIAVCLVINKGNPQSIHF